MRTHAIVWLLAAGCLASGCAYTTPIGPVAKMTPAQRNFEAVWEASRDVLHRYDFTLDRQDRRAGVITTLPIIGRQWFEFWRKDAASSFSKAEGSVQTIYRAAKVRILPAAKGQRTYHPVVEVIAFRSDQKHLQVTSTSEAFSLYTTPGGEKERSGLLLNYGQEKDEKDKLGKSIKKKEYRDVTPLGRDRDLEAKLTAAIRAAAAKNLYR